MKNILIALFFFIGSAYPAASQHYSLFSKTNFAGSPVSPAKPDKTLRKDHDLLSYPFRNQHIKSVRFGIKAGLNISNMNFNKGYSGSSTPLESARKTGLSLGLIMEVPLFDKLQLNQEYLYSRMGGEFQPLNATYAFDYISIPVLLSYSFFPKFSLVAGPQFELLIKGKESINGQSSLVTQTTEERNIGLTVGMAYQITGKIGFNTRFMHGFNHIGIFQRTGRKEFKYELIQVSTDFFF